MIHQLITLSVRNKLLVGAAVLAIAGIGLWSLQHLPLDAVPDITNNQVQVVTTSPSLAAEEVEQFITTPVELSMANLPDVTEIRSISRYGLSVVTIVFKESVPLLDTRQYVREQIGIAMEQIPVGFGQPELMPITTGLGEIYQYVLEVQPGYESRYSPMELRTIQDWIVKRQLAGIEGIIEISSFGGYLKQYEVSIDPVSLQAFELSLSDVFQALERNNQNSGGSSIDKTTNAWYIRTEGMVSGTEDIERIVVGHTNGLPVLIRDVARVILGSPKRLGGMTMDGKGEAVGGITLMLKGANSSEAIAQVQKRVEEVQKSLPEGIKLYPYLDRSTLISKAIATVRTNLLEGGLIVIIVLFLLLGNLRAGLIVASVIPLSLLFAIILMRQFGISANLMSLGAIDFGIVVDGAVIVVEGVLHTLVAGYAGRELSRRELEGVVINSSGSLFRSAVFGVFIILVVFVPVLTLTGIEGKMFRPMALTLSFTLLGALLLSLTYVPVALTLVLPRKINDKKTVSDRFIASLQKLYAPVLRGALRHPYAVLATAVGLMIGAGVLFSRMGSEFIPTLEEGDLAMQMTIPPGSSLNESMRSTTKAENILRSEFPEVLHVVSKIGTAEVPTDPMAIEDADIMIILKDRGEWVSAASREELVEKMKEALSVITGASFEFTQPIQLRFNELMTGAKTDLAIRVFGDDHQTLKRLGDRIGELIQDVPGAADIKVEQTDGLPQLKVIYDRDKLAEHGVSIDELNLTIRAAYAGEKAGIVLEGQRTFDLVVRLNEGARSELDLDQLFVTSVSGATIPLSELARVEYREAPMQISRENASRRITIGVNVRNRDIAGLVDEIQGILDAKLDLPPGYLVRYGGTFENLERARSRLLVAVPAALALILLLLYLAFGQIGHALIIFTGVPLAAIGGIAALWLRDMPFSISAGIGFIALFGVSVLNGIVLISSVNSLRQSTVGEPLDRIIEKAGLSRLRPVLMTATVAALGFIPMALSTTNGAEVQRPLATVVIGGLITATILTLVVLPVLYKLTNSLRLTGPSSKAALAVLLLVVLPALMHAQPEALPILTEQQALEQALANHPGLTESRYAEQIAGLSADAIRELPPTQIQVGYGQFDGTLLDYSVQITQGLGNKPANTVRRSIGAQDLAMATSQTRQLTQQIALDVRRAWQHWVFRSALADLAEEQFMRYDSLSEMTARQFQSGAISALEKQLADQSALNARAVWLSAQNDQRNARIELERLGYLSCDGLESPPPAPLILPMAPTGGPNQLHTETWDILSRQAGLQGELMEKLLLPEFSVSYLNLSLRPEVPLHGVYLGVDVPLTNRGAFQARKNQYQIRQAVSQQQKLQVIHNLQKRYDGLVRQRDALSAQLDELTRALDPAADSILSSARLQLEEGAIPFFDYTRIAETHLQTRRLRLETLYSYNITLLEILYLTAEAASAQ